MMETTLNDVEQAAIEMLAGSSIRDLRQVHVQSCSDKAIELSGSVRSYYHKQLAQETVRTVAPGTQVINRIEVSA